MLSFVTRALGAIFRALEPLRRGFRQPAASRLTDAEIVKRLRTGDFRVFNEAPRLLYWSASEPPHRFVREDVPAADRAAVISALASGQPLLFMMGYAQCRICNTTLGSCDMLTHGMIYPQRAEHYLLEHGVWTSGCDELLRRVRAESTARVR